MKTDETTALPDMIEPEENTEEPKKPETEIAGSGLPEDILPGEEALENVPRDPRSAEQGDPVPHEPEAAGSGIPAVYCYGLTKSYGAVEALSELSVALPAGKIIGLLGPNGSGKTTLIKILAGLLKPTSGEALVCGEKPGASSKAFVSYLPERMYFDPGMKVKECIRVFRDFYADFDEGRALQLLAAMDVPTDRRLKTLSKGTKEKVQLILVMSRRARLYLLDEPIGGVDPAARDLILSTIVREHDPEATVLISTHLIRDVEPVLDGFLFLSGGKCVMSGDAEEVRRGMGKTLDELFREVFRCL